MTEPQQLTSQDMAGAAGITVESFYEFRRRGQVPVPDGRVGRTPYWHRRTLEKWLRSRRGVGRPRSTEA